MPSVTIKPLGHIAAAFARMQERLYTPPPVTIAGIPDNAWPNPLQPPQPIGPPGAKPLGWPMWSGQNLIYTPRADASYDATQLMALSMYPLARMCIDNTKDVLGQVDWTITLKQMPGETKGDIQQRRKKNNSGDEVITLISKFFEYPNPDQDWSEWLRRVVEDMLVTDSASILLEHNSMKQLVSMRAIPGHSISCYVDDQGYTPRPPSPAYAQLWEGIPRIDLTTEQLIYRPRNIVPRAGMNSSYLYGCGPTESIADEIKVGMGRLAFVLAFYDRGSISNMLHFAPADTPNEVIKEAVDLYNSQMAGDLARRRQYVVFQGFRTDEKPEQVVFPKEPVLADTFDDVHVRKISFAYGTSAQRLQRAMNRGSAMASQSAAQEEGIRPWMDWVRRLCNHIIQRRMGYEGYELTFEPYFESDYFKKSRADCAYVHEGIRTRRAVRNELGDDPTDNPLEDQLTVTTANGVVRLGETITSGGGGDGTPPPKPATKPNGKIAHGDDPRINWR